MKDLNLKSILFSVLTIVLSTIFLTSCEPDNIVKDDVGGWKSENIIEEEVLVVEDDVSGWKPSPVINQYPKEITMNNWEEFIHAPQKVIDYHIEKERQLNQSAAIQNKNSCSPLLTNLNSPESICNLGFLCGKVKGYNGNWKFINNVDVTMDQCATKSCKKRMTHNNYYLADDYGIQLCMDYASNAVEGITQLDLLAIARHTNNIERFTTARQYLAADANRDGIINVNDINLLQSISIGNFAEWPNSDNIIFVKFIDYSDIQNQITPPTFVPLSLNGETDSLNEIDQSLLSYVGQTPSCLSKNFINRRAIKTGDVNGTFSF